MAYLWLTTPEWTQESQRWTANIVNQIAEDYVENKQKDMTYSYEDACKTSGYNHINGNWQKGKDPTTGKSNPVYRRLQSAVGRVQKRREKQEAENSVRRVQQQQIRGPLTPSIRVLGPLQPVTKSFRELLKKYDNMQQRYTHTV